MTAKPYGPTAPDGSQYITLTDGNGTLVTALTPSGSAGGDLAGTYPNPTITNASVIAKVLTGYASGSGTISAADTILGAVQKLNGNDALKAPLASPTFTGTVTVPAGAAIATPNITGVIDGSLATAGNVGEYRSASNADTSQGQFSSTVTITIASPAVITWGTTTPFVFNGNGTAVINFTTTGALPTGIVAGTNYYVIGSSVSGNTFQIATTVDNAIAGTAINTSGSQSGTHTGLPTAILTNGVVINIAAISLTAGDWDVSADNTFFSNTTTSITSLLVSTSLLSGNVNLNPGRFYQFATAAQIPGIANNSLHSGPAQFRFSSTTTIYCVALSNFTVSTLTVWGGLRARRIR